LIFSWHAVCEAQGREQKALGPMSVNIVSSEGPERPGILAAIRDASLKTGADFGYLLSTAMRESGLNSGAKAKSSSATGLFQFVDQTWLGMVKRYGARHGLEAAANTIGEDGKGHYSVASEEAKSAILALRKDARLSALMAGEAAVETKKNLECALKRELCEGELYAAHFLGPGNARKLISLNGERPECFAAEEFPAAARANKTVFYNPDGSAKTVREVYAWATGLPEPAQSKVQASAIAVPAKAREIAEALPPPSHQAQAPMPPIHTFAAAAPVFPRPPLQLSMGILEILASMTPFAASARR
jgi:hypothetical protein